MTGQVDAEEFWPDPYLPEWKQLDEAKGERPFTEASFELLREIGTLALLVASAATPDPLPRNEAILRGHFAKQGKICL
ncbi:MAG: hypothetical protein M3290_06140, partial [Actinomycetota bacterium]|nr:hypothetical protein [Actinomycetota bacterium]